MIAISISIPSLCGSAAPSTADDWILATGFWNDSGVWDDAATWID